jgi:hypothetical protein
VPGDSGGRHPAERAPGVAPRRSRSRDQPAGRPRRDARGWTTEREEASCRSTQLSVARAGLICVPYRRAPGRVCRGRARALTPGLRCRRRRLDPFTLAAATHRINLHQQRPHRRAYGKPPRRPLPCSFTGTVILADHGLRHHAPRLSHRSSPSAVYARLRSDARKAGGNNRWDDLHVEKHVLVPLLTTRAPGNVGWLLSVGGRVYAGRDGDLQESC